MIAAAADYAPRASDAATQGAHDTTVALHDPNRLTEQFRSDWRDLARHSAVANPFFSQRFLDAALHQLSRGDSIRLLTFRANEDDALIFLAPIIKQCGYAKLPLCYYAIWTHAHCFNGTPLVRKNEEQLALTALARWIDTEPDGALFFRMPCFIDEASLAHWTAPSSSIAARMKVQRCHQRAAVGANADINAHLTSALSGKKQKELRRQFRRLGDHGAVSFQTRSVDAATLRAFERLENAGWKAEAAEGRPLAGSATDHAFFVEACLGDPNAMCLALNVDQRPIAMLIMLKSGDRLSAFKIAHDTAWSAYSPGVHLLIEAARRANADPTIDMLDSCARENHPVVDRLWPDRIMVSQLNIPSRSLVARGALSLAAGLEAMKMKWLDRRKPSPSAHA